MGEMPGHDDKSEDKDSADVVLDPRIQETIGNALKAHYDDLIKAPVPDRFLVLLAELEAKERQNGQ
ncbi:NepR family anti-sigma factor [Phreatobacter sp.]|uniref:NepR family anti-sigma factor n=1 Tax=Phreatobacter sp. TaxID=1966341 RepID=UPI0025E00E4E|nr:NepR family anti-sigma factor [Phreatobacter sp.]